MDLSKFFYGFLIYAFHVGLLICHEDHGKGHGNAEHGHDHGTPKTQEEALKYMKDTAHIREHLKEQYGFDEKGVDEYMKEYDAQTQYFVMHDYDGNKKLDGLELLKSMTHFHDDSQKEEPPIPPDMPDPSDQLMEFVDMIMKEQDKNDDGYIDYPEYFNYYKRYTDAEQAKKNPDADEQGKQ